MTQDQEKLIADNIKLVYYCIQKLNINRQDSDYDDYVSIGNMGLVKAALSYNPAKYKFSTYAYFVITNEIKMEFRRRSAKMNQYILVSLNEPIFENILLEDIIQSDEDVAYSYQKRSIIDKYNSLQFKHKDLFNDYLRGMKQKELEKKYHIANAYRIIKSIKELLRKELY